jgi:uncharacterized protein
LKQCSYGLALCVSSLLTACASQPDHFYTLNPLPDGAHTALVAAPLHVILTVTIPVVVDRSEMVLTTSSNAILVLDHERWAAPLSDQVSQTLARDIEKRRSDVLVGDRGFDQAVAPSVSMKVDIVRMSAPRGTGRALIEAHWRIVDAAAGMDEIGGDLFDAAVEGNDYASIAKGFSLALSDLAARLADPLRRP